MKTEKVGDRGFTNRIEEFAAFIFLEGRFTRGPASCEPFQYSRGAREAEQGKWIRLKMQATDRDRAW